ncbi:hypothetical protein AAFF_G00332950 [Aldrovandia affinis]|uniref:Uncharacterized protein n=1 Tax=Aldrovandia affinis TaxID=143900 RepID=A0AAD7WQ55_9TELE|nr:hypothetical protein AAFF_G00332950 [Aldrovandia affinis]
MQCERNRRRVRERSCPAVTYRQRWGDVRLCDEVIKTRIKWNTGQKNFVNHHPVTVPLYSTSCAHIGGGTCGGGLAEQMKAGPL